jgi:hypothetical protein
MLRLSHPCGCRLSAKRKSRARHRHRRRQLVRLSHSSRPSSQAPRPKTQAHQDGSATEPARARRTRGVRAHCPAHRTPLWRTFIFITATLYSACPTSVLLGIACIGVGDSMRSPPRAWRKRDVLYGTRYERRSSERALTLNCFSPWLVDPSAQCGRRSAATSTLGGSGIDASRCLSSTRPRAVPCSVVAGLDRVVRGTVAEGVRGGEYDHHEHDRLLDAWVLAAGARSQQQPCFQSGSR